MKGMVGGMGMFATPYNMDDLKDYLTREKTKEENEIEKMFKVSPYMETIIFNLASQTKDISKIDEALCSKINSTMVYIGLDSGNFQKLFELSNKGSQEIKFSRKKKTAH